MASLRRAKQANTKFRNTIFGYLREHEKSESINIPAIIKFLCLEYYLLTEEWVSCWNKYPEHWELYTPAALQQIKDWRTRTEFSVGERISYFFGDDKIRTRGEVERLKRNDDGKVIRILIRFDNFANAPGQVQSQGPQLRWINVPSHRFFPNNMEDPRLLDSPHLPAMSGTVPINTSDQSIVQYRWTFEVGAIAAIQIKLRRQGDIPIPPVRYPDQLRGVPMHIDHDEYVFLENVDLSMGIYMNSTRVEVTMDMERSLLKMEIDREIINKCKVPKLNGIYFLVIRRSRYHYAENKECLISDMDKLLKLVDFSIVQRPIGH